MLLLKYPALQVHVLLPTGLDELFGQGKHELCPWEFQVSATHFEHVRWDMAPTDVENEPASHNMQVVRPVLLEYEPFWQT